MDHNVYRSYKHTFISGFLEVSKFDLLLFISSIYNLDLKISLFADDFKMYSSTSVGRDDCISLQFELSLSESECLKKYTISKSYVIKSCSFLQRTETNSACFVNRLNEVILKTSQKKKIYSSKLQKCYQPA